MLVNGQQALRKLSLLTAILVVLAVSVPRLGSAPGNGQAQSPESWAWAKPAASPTPAAAPEASPAAPPAPTEKKSGPATYVGSKACLECHEDYSDTFNRTAHAKTKNTGPDAANQCESCHGPGSVHVEEGGGNVGIITFKNMPATKVNAACNKCHEGHQNLYEWRFSKHATSAVSCIDCHQPHAKKKEDMSAFLLRKKGEPELCYSCHLNVKAEANWPYHHPIAEGRMVCSDCHNVHGSQLSAYKKGPTARELCLSCHTQYRGPFAKDHAPVTDSCMNCHRAHGSMESNLLVASEPFLCQRCHATVHNPHVAPASQTPATIANQALYFSRCTVCHSNVHGSEQSNTYTR